MNTLSMSKIHASIFAAILGIVSMAPAPLAQGQEMGGVVNVPFAFETGSQHFEAGVYTIRMESTSSILSIHGKSSVGLVMTRLDRDFQPASKGKMVFRRTGGKYFLSELWVADKTDHLVIPRSKAESNLQLAGNKTAPQNVELAVLQDVR